MIARDSGPAARWARLTELFDQLAELTPAARRSAQSEVARRDPELARDLERLLAADAIERDLLDRPLELALPARDAVEGPSDEPDPGRAGVFRIVGRLGRGGMAEVFAGERDDGAFEQRVAIKVLRRGLDTEDLLARFARERQILARLEHPAISRLLDAGRLADGRPYLVMERVDGVPIHRFAEERALSLEARLRLLLAAGDAVAFAHRNLVVHRDLKPSNVLVTASGDLKLLDFGIAKLLTPEAEVGSPATARESRALTPAYAAPEQILGAPTTTATDVWGLGALAYELLVHEPPYTTSAGRVAFDSSSVPTTPPPRPSARLRDKAKHGAGHRREAARLEGDLDLIVGTALSLDPRQRYSSVEAFCDDLRRHLGGRPIRARPASLAYRLAKFVGRHRGFVAAAALVAASLAVGGGIALWQARAAARERARPLPSVRFLTYSGQDSSPAASRDGRTIAFRSQRDGRSRIWLANPQSGDEAPLTEGSDTHPRISPDGLEILFTRFADGVSAVHLAPLSSGRSSRRFDDALFGDFSPDGGRIAILRQSRGPSGVESVVVVVGRREGEPREVARLAGRALHPPRWSPDSRTIAITASSLGIGERAAVALVDVESGRIRVVPVSGSSPRGLAWSGIRRLVYAQPDTVLGWVTGGSARVVLHDLASNAVRNVLASPVGISAVEVAGAGRLVYSTGSFRVNLREIDLESGELEAGRRWLSRGDSSDRQPSYSPDGGSIVYSSTRGGNLDLWIQSLATGAARRLTDDPALDWDPVFTADGRLLWSTNRTGAFEIWRAEADGSGAVQLSRDGVDAENPSATPDGVWILFSSRDPGRRGIQRMRSDGSASTRLVGGEIFLPELSPDGRHVAYLDLGDQRPVLRVASVEDGRPIPFEIRFPLSDPGADPDLGRCRWFPDGRSLAVLARDGDGNYVVERHTVRFDAADPAMPVTRIAFEAGHAAETFGISPDGRRLVVAFWDTTSNLMLADDVPGIEP